MNKLRARPGYKAMVVSMLIISILTALISGAGFLWMAEEDYYRFEETFDNNRLGIRLSEVSFEETWTPEYEVRNAASYLLDSLDIKLSSDDEQVSEDELLTSIQLEDGRKLHIGIVEESEESLENMLSNVSLTLRDSDGSVIYKNTPAVKNEAYESYILIGFDSKGNIQHMHSGSDEGFLADCFNYRNISRKELAEYAFQNARHLFYMTNSAESDYFDTSYSTLSSSDIFTSDAQGQYAYIDPNANSHVVMYLDGAQYVAYAMDVLNDYVWHLMGPNYYDYGYDDENDGYYVATAETELITPAVVLSCSASLLDEKDFEKDIAVCRSLYEMLYPHRITAIVLIVLSVIVGIASFILMLCYAGWRKDSDKPQMRPIDKIPLEIFCLAAVLLGALIISAAGEVANSFGEIIDVAGVALCGILFAALCIVFLMSIARRIKTRTFFKNTVCVYAYRLIKKFAAALPSIWLVVIVGLVYGVFSLICILSIHDSPIPFLFWCVGSIALFAAVCITVYQFDKVSKTAEKISKGDMQCRVNTEKLMPQLKRHGDSINRIGDSVTLAVESRMKSERMKTDLIANVSHDIKTPLTSVINYIDLLKRTDIRDAKALEYIAVLERQSVRLKRLVQDIVDASKASSGCISADIKPVDLRELIDQTIAEYADRMAACHVEPVITVDDDCAGVMADGRLLWRVFDNLLSNICKYSQSGTRAYIKAVRVADSVEISFRNISAEALDISAEMLMERFVRGDRSRHTDGSGLGLSIAQSLVELQNGRLELSIDGDLFRASVTLPACGLPETAADVSADSEADAVYSAEMIMLTDSQQDSPAPENEWLELPALDDGTEQ